MVNLKELRRMKEELQRNIEDIDAKNLKIDGIQTKKTKVNEKVFMGLIDLSKLDSHSAEISSDKTITISGLGNIELNIKEDSKIILRLSNGIIRLRINVAEGVRVQLLEVLEGVKLSKELDIQLGEASKLERYELVLNSAYSISTVSIKNMAHYNLKSVFYSASSLLYHINNSIQIGKNSHSTMSIRGIAVKGARVISEGLIRVDKKATSSYSSQNIQGLIIDENSHITSEPSLEIETNDVRCSHAASISQISKDILFYMNSRGLSEKDTIDLITEGLIVEVLTPFDSHYVEKIMDVIQK